MACSFAAGCYVELYRQYNGKDAEKAVSVNVHPRRQKPEQDAQETYAKCAEELILKVPTFMGKKRFMAQSLPLEVFADRKIKKWQARATARGIRLVDGVGASPISEMIYIWSKLYLLCSQKMARSD